MVPSFRRRAKHWVAKTFCMLLAAGGVAPSPARAGCGHDVTSNLIRSTWESLSDLELLKEFRDGSSRPGTGRPSPGIALLRPILLAGSGLAARTCDTDSGKSE